MPNDTTNDPSLPHQEGSSVSPQIPPQQPGQARSFHGKGVPHQHQGSPYQQGSQQYQENSYQGQEVPYQGQTSYQEQVNQQAQVYPTANTSEQHYYAHAAQQATSQAQQPAPPTKHKRVGLGVSFLMGLLGVIVGAALSIASLYIATSGFSFSGSVDTSQVVINPTDEDTELAEAVASKVTTSVVNIDVYATPSNSLLEDFFGGENDARKGDSTDITEQTGLGSGVILSTDGYILTNYHVVEGGERFMVSLGDTQLEAILVGYDATSDLAVIKVETDGLTPIEIGDSDAVDVGEWVMAVGSPYGLEKSVSTGIVSALYRSTAMQSQSGVTIYANLIQTDAAINPGNSGGALVNSKGELIGINTLISSSSGASSGVGFAVPSNYAFEIAEAIINGEDVSHPFLGVTLNSVDASNAAQLGVSVQSGAYVESVQAGSPAEQAGILAGDVITTVEEKNISTSAELIIEVRRLDIGQTVSVVVNRGGSSQTFEVVLGSTSD